MERTNEETVELLLAWLREYGLTIIIGIALGLATIFGYRAYESNRLESRQEATAQLIQLSQATDFNQQKALHDSLKNTDLSAMADLIYGRQLKQAEKYQEAVAILQSASKSQDEWVRALALQDLVYAQIGLTDYENAQKTIEQLRGSALNVIIPELQGFLAIKQNKLKDALAIYEGIERPTPIIQLTINALRSQVALNP